MTKDNKQTGSNTNSGTEDIDDFKRRAEAGENPEQYSPMQEEQNKRDAETAKEAEETTSETEEARRRQDEEAR